MQTRPPAIDAVLKADKERWVLVQEEKNILAEIEKLNGAERIEA